MSIGNDLPTRGHVADLLPAFANGTLAQPERAQVMHHLRRCPACAADLRAWQAIREAARANLTPLPALPAAILDGVWAALDDIPETSWRARSQPQDMTTSDQHAEATMTTDAISAHPGFFPVPNVSGGFTRWPPARPLRRTLATLALLAAVLALVLTRSIVPEQRELARLGSLLPWQQAMPPDVPAFRGNPEHSGESPGPGPTSKPDILWQIKTGGQIKTSPVLVNGVLYVSSLDGHVYAFDHATGEERWGFDTGGAPQASLTVAEGLVFVGDNNPYQQDGTLFVLDAADGTERWRLPDAQTSAPLVVEGTLYAGTSDGVFHAFRADDGAELWQVAGAPLSRGASLANGLLFYGAKDGVVYARDVAGGAERWKYQTEGGQIGTLAVVDGIAFAITFDGPADQLYALDAASGAERWRFAINARLQNPAVKDGMVYLPGGDGSVYALDAATGTVRWRFDIGDPTVYGPVISGDTLYIVSGNPLLYAVNASTGKEVWHVELDGPSGTSPIVSGGVIYAITEAGSLYALGERTEDPPVVLPAASSTASTESPVEFLWAAANGSEPIDMLGGMALAPDGNLWLVEGNQNRLMIFSPEGAFLEAWGSAGPSEGEFNFNLPDYGGAYGDISFDQDGAFYVLDSGNRRVQKFDRNRQFVSAWGTQGTGDGQFLAPQTLTIDAEGNVYISDDGRGDIQKFTRDGEYLATIADRGTGDGQTSCLPPFGVDKDGILYVPDCIRHIVQKFGPDGAFLEAWGQEGRGEGEFNFPTDVSFDTAGHVYIADAGNNRIQVFTSDGDFVTQWGSFGTGDGEFNGAGPVLLDGQGNVYVGDGAGRVQKFRLLPPLAP